MLYYEKGWFTERSRVYKEISERDDLLKKLDSTFFYFNSPEAGWIDMEMYLNGKKRFVCPCSNVILYEPFQDMIRWLEAIVRGDNMETTIRIDTEGDDVYLHYEMLRDEDFWISTINNWRSSSEHSSSEIGLFFVYDSCSDNIPLYAVCETKDFVNSIYLALLAVCGDCYQTYHSDFAKEWYYGENMGRTGRKFDNMTFYNDIKSPLIEWNIRATDHCRYDIRFKKMLKIKETISMWCDYGNALFWGRDKNGYGACYGGVESFITNTAGEIKLDSIKGLREWYDEYDTSELPHDWNSKRWKSWLERGYSFALQVRQLLPDTIDLYYYDWYPKKKVVRAEFPEKCPMIVFNEKSLIKP